MAYVSKFVQEWLSTAVFIWFKLPVKIEPRTFTSSRPSCPLCYHQWHEISYQIFLPWAKNFFQFLPTRVSFELAACDHSKSFIALSRKKRGSFKFHCHFHPTLLLFITYWTENHGQDKGAVRNDRSENSPNKISPTLFVGHVAFHGYQWRRVWGM